MDTILVLLELLVLLILFIATIHCSFVVLHSDGLFRAKYLDLSESIVDSDTSAMFIQISNVERSPPAKSCFEIIRQQVQTPTLMPTLYRDLAAETVLGRNEYNDYNIYTARHTR